MFGRCIRLLLILGLILPVAPSWAGNAVAVAGVAAVGGAMSDCDMAMNDSTGGKRNGNCPMDMGCAYRCLSAAPFLVDFAFIAAPDDLALRVASDPGAGNVTAPVFPPFRPPISSTH